MTGLKKALLIIVGCSLLFLLFRAAFKSGSPGESVKSSQKNVVAEVKLTAKDHIERAKYIISEGFKKDQTLSQIEEIRGHLNAIPIDSPEYKEGQKIKTLIDRKESEVKKAVAIEDKKKAVEERKEFASEMEKNLLLLNMDATVRVFGKDSTTLQITYILVNRPTVYQFMNDETTMGRLRSHGFRIVRLSDGYDKAWTIKVGE